ncbi:hypothetical protein F4781DRAFT_395828 [Annulohypoxylon bovei var. microspora]|nr:hypothetical protein F4781DRAFT_395828 [Annulohypoxylon bovei var. microspora]
MSRTNSKNLSEILKKYNSFNELPDPNPLPEHKIFLRQCKPSHKAFSKWDIEARNHEEYLRSNYDCSEVMLAGFDPEKLEPVLQARFKPNTEIRDITTDDSELYLEDELCEVKIDVENQEYEDIPNDVYSKEVNYSSESLTDVSVAGSLDFDEYESEAIVDVASAEKFTRVSCGTESITTVIRRSVTGSIGRRPTPRIRIGSKPPLSRSAFAGAGLPSPKDGTPGQRAGATLRGYPKAPKYFPFKSKVRK